MYATTDLNILKECANVNDRTNDQIYMKIAIQYTMYVLLRYNCARI